MYAGGVTIWTNSGSDGAISDSLQEAANGVQEYVRHNGLTCSSSKSELLIVRSKAKKDARHGRPTTSTDKNYVGKRLGSSGSDH